MCQIQGCDGEIVARGLCGMHYRRLMRHGSVEATRPSDWGSREKHPLYQQWTWMRRKGKAPIDDSWGDFWKFVKDVPERPSENHRLDRVDKTKPYGPSNFYWREAIIQKKEVHGRDQSGKSTNTSAVWLREMRRVNPDYFRNMDLKRSYGIGIEEYRKMEKEQGGECAICKNPETSTTSKGVLRLLAVDHNHSTGKIRALLCQGCNQGLGNFQEDLTRLEAAVAYLKQFATI